MRTAASGQHRGRCARNTTVAVPGCDRPINRPTDRPIDRTTNRSIDRSTNQPIDHPTDQQTGRPTEQTIDGGLQKKDRYRLQTHLVLLQDCQHCQVEDDQLHRDLQLRHAVPELQLYVIQSVDGWVGGREGGWVGEWMGGPVGCKARFRLHWSGCCCYDTVVVAVVVWS